MRSRDTSRAEGESGESQINEGRGEQVAADSVALGDVIFIKLRGGSWWPAQVLDDNCVNKSNKLSKRSAGEVLVRLYGSYTYLYTDPIKCRSEFEGILKQNNGSHGKILLEALEKDLPSTKPRRAKESTSKTKEADKKAKQYRTDSQHGTKIKGSQRKCNTPVKEAKRKSSKGNEMLKNHEANGSRADGRARKRAPDLMGTPSQSNTLNFENKRSKTSGQDKQQSKAKSLSPGAGKKVTKNQDRTMENVEQRISRSKSEAKRRSYKQDEEQKKCPRSKPNEVQNKVKRGKQNEILNDDNPSSQSPVTGINSLDTSPELSTRRIRVMKSLGLIAPLGSPFHKDGHIYNVS